MWGLLLFISQSGVQGGVTQCVGCSPDPQTPVDMFNGQRFLSRQREKEGEGYGGLHDGGRGGWTLTGKEEMADESGKKIKRKDERKSNEWEN